MSEAPDPDELLDLLGDEYVRNILTATSEAPMSASQLSETCDMSLPTVYRRVDALEEHGLLVERTEPDPDGGHHRTVFEAAVDGLDVAVSDGELVVTVRPREDAVDRFTRVWEDIRD